MQKKYMIGISAFVLAAAVFAAAYFYTDMKLRLPKASTSTVSQESGGNTAAEASVAKVSEKDIINEIHLMSNSLIVAGDKQVWGTEDITKAKVEKVLKEIDQLPASTRTKKLREIMVSWQQGDFSQIVDDHNYVWDLLGGTVGMATGANSAAVANATANMKDSGQ